MSVYYQLILYLHVFSATLSIGPFFVLVPLIGRMKSADESALDVQLAVFQSAVRLVKHAGHLLVLSGVFLIISSGYRWTTSWVAMTILVMLASVVFLASAFKPVIRKIRRNEADRGQLLDVLNRKLWTYILLLLLMLYFMVVKPDFW
ncbi:DUF2269 family protein [Bhargavaea beijingensis]|uniref:DUF2269 family protein n=1 Tax=Bhargavaea beijingensis TaxID=426756 RepID=A0A1G7D6S1_9BACL|nr:hypothetical protein [Bhargavaea beijingensis]MCW1929202.1 hypothetical protein [Bhargavaea beijingensis]RSK24478.1 hypothetical protein EJA12_13915 [Bhargavaea beijingensis]SDE47207.1 hypothetical protein SAMN04488126_10991 [Bhargavaea beijingensis]